MFQESLEVRKSVRTPPAVNPSTKSVNVQNVLISFHPHLLGQSDLHLTFTYKLDFGLHSFWIEQIYSWIVKLIANQTGWKLDYSKLTHSFDYLSQCLS